MNDEKLLKDENLGKDEILELLRCALNKSGMLRAVGRVTSRRNRRLAVLVVKDYLQVKNPAHIYNSLSTSKSRDAQLSVACIGWLLGTKPPTFDADKLPLLISIWARTRLDPPKLPNLRRSLTSCQLSDDTGHNHL